MPFGPEISWPYGFRQLDSESRQILESAYGTGSHQPPAADDFGYGDPGYSDPSYEGTSYGGHVSPGQNGGYRGAAAPQGFGGSGYRQPDAGVPGYHVPEVRDSGRSWASPGYQPQDYAPPPGGRDIWPVTGAQEALPDTGPQPAASAWNTGSSGSGQAGTARPERWYDHPRPGDRAAGDLPPSRSADPRLEGMTYGELRYDDAEPVTPRNYDEPLDDESWYRELRRSAPAYPQRPGGPGAGGPPESGGSPSWTQPQGPGSGRPAGYPQAPDRSAGPGHQRGDWGGSGPQMSAGRTTSPGSRPGGAFPPDPAPRGTGFLSAPVGQVSVLTPPTGTRVDALRDPDTFPAVPAAPRTGTAASQVLTAPGTTRPGAGPARPGHGLDGPEITSSWPAQPATDDLDSYEDFWRDDADEEYTGLFGNREAEFERADAKQAAAKRRIGRRRGGSNDRRLWLGLGGVVIVAAAAITGILKFEFPSHSGPAHVMGIPPKTGTYVRTVDLERQAGLDHLRAEVIQMSSGQASHVVSAIYESGNSAAGNTTEIIMFIGGHLANADPAASIGGFTQKFADAHVVSAGTLGGQAACAEEGTNASNSVAICAWFDNDSFGEIASPTMSAGALAAAMRTIRPSVETLAPK